MTANLVVPQAVFGPGLARITRTDVVAGSYDVGYVQEFSLDMKREMKELYGSYTYPLAVGAGTTKVTGKLKAATLSGETINNIFFGGTFTAGTQYDITSDVAQAIPATPYQLTPTPPNSGTFAYDLGVINAVTGEPMTLVTGTPTAGQYSVTGGEYTFSSADHTAGVTVTIFYAYSWMTGANGQNIVIPNQLIGSSPTFQLDYKTVFGGQIYQLTMFNGVCTGASLAHKLTDFAMPEYDLAFFVNAAGNLGRMSLASQA
jgi:hypothetical protein